MIEFRFEALGTAWTILIDSEDTSVFSESIKQKILVSTDRFDRQLSRFISTSEANRFKSSPAGEYPISPQLMELLQVSENLRTITGGQYDPAVGGLLENSGYDKTYSFRPQNSAISDWKLPQWSINKQKQTVIIGGPVVFDIGGIGKGYWIDKISQLLLEEGLKHHLVDGGGDMMATTKAAGSGWSVAIEWPGKEDTAIGTIELKNQGFAASDIFRRRWSEWHHIISLAEKKPVDSILGCVAVGKNAWIADQATSALAVGTSKQYQKIAKSLEVEYFVLTTTNRLECSEHWQGTFFT